MNNADERRPSVAAIPVSKRNSNLDDSWKVVGSPPRKNSFQLSSHIAMAKRPSLASIKDHESDIEKNGPNDHPLSSSFTRKGSNAGQWVSMGGFQWEGPSIFDDHSGQGDEHSRSIKAVPMVPDVSTEPIYREHRSFSFSVGQDPSFFGYDDYDEIESTISSIAYQNQLATMEEEDDVDLNGALKDRLRSQSSGAALGLLSAQHRAHLTRIGERRGSEQLDEAIARRRTSSFANDATSKFGSSFGSQRSSFLQPSSLSQSYGYQDYTALEHQAQRRMSQTEQHSGFQHMHPIQQMQYLSEHLDATRLSEQHQMPFMNPSYPSHVMPMMADPQMGMPMQHHPGFSMPYMMDQHSEYYNNQNYPREQQDKGVSYKQVAEQAQLFLVEFKTSRSEVFYVADPSQLQIRVGDLVIVEADRGKDLGKVTSEPLSVEKATEIQKKHVQQQQQQQQNEHGQTSADPSLSPPPLEPSQPEAETDTKPLELNPKRIYRLALPGEVAMLIQKSDDEQKALTLCQIKVKQKKLTMEVVDAEYQWYVQLTVKL